MGDAAFKSPHAYDYVSAEHVRPRADNVLIRWAFESETTPSGLVALPKARDRRSIDGRLAIVVSAGDGPSPTRNCQHCGHALNPYPMGVRPGDVVVADGSQCGELLYVNGIEHRLVREAELLEVWEPETEEERTLLDQLRGDVVPATERAS